MDNQEAIKTLRELRRETNDSWYEAVYDMAISALEAEPCEDAISRQAAIDAAESIGSLDTEADKKYARSVFEALPSAQPEKRTEERTETHACDLIDRQAAIDAIYHHLPSVSRMEARLMLHEVPSAQPEPLSDAYMKSVWTWLLEYQIKAAELKGRYTPYEVLSWVVNDWRKEHE